MSKNTRYALIGIAVLVTLVVVRSIAATTSAPSVTVTEADLRRAVGARATVVPHGEVAHVMPTVAGRVTAVIVAVGDVVTARQVLARIEPNDAAPSFDLLGEDEALTAPIAGTVIAVRVNTGDAVSGIVPPPLPLFEIADLSALDLRIEVAEADAARVEVGQTVRIDDGGEHETRIERLSPRIERREFPFDDVVSRAASRVRVAYAPLPEGFTAPAYSNLNVILEDEAVHVETALPREAILIREGRAAVRVRSGIFASERFVTLGICDDEHVAVEGLSAGTEVLLR
jgi:multidrug efflux pump subunit AcrA (membrane-fusion protein)